MQELHRLRESGLSIRTSAATAGYTIYKLLKPPVHHLSDGQVLPADPEQIQGTCVLCYAHSVVQSGDFPRNDEFSKCFQKQPHTHLILADVPSNLSLGANDCVFEVWETYPGPGLEDFRFKFDSLDRAIDAVLQFYWGRPIILAGWVVPLHRHPELPREGLERILQQAETVTALTFSQIVDERVKALDDQILIDHEGSKIGLGWPLSLQAQFLPLSHKSDTTRTLYLRRDGQEAYVVE